MRLAIQTDFRHGGPDSAMATLDEPRPHATWRWPAGGSRACGVWP